MQIPPHSNLLHAWQPKQWWNKNNQHSRFTSRFLFVFLCFSWCVFLQTSSFYEVWTRVCRMPDRHKHRQRDSKRPRRVCRTVQVLHPISLEQLILLQSMVSISCYFLPLPFAFLLFHCLPLSLSVFLFSLYSVMSFYIYSSISPPIFAIIACFLPYFALDRSVQQPYDSGINIAQGYYKIMFLYPPSSLYCLLRSSFFAFFTLHLPFLTFVCEELCRSTR